MKIDNLEDSLGNLESDCGLASGFCLDLLRQDEWSFVIKVHALLEAAVAQLLVHALGRKELIDVFGALGMGNTKSGKLAFVRALSLLPKQYIEFISALSVLRNQLAHGVKNVTVELKKHFATERDRGAKQEARKLADKWGFGLKDGDKFPEPLARYHFKVTIPNGSVLSREVVFHAAPKNAILFSALAVLDAISMSNRYGEHVWAFLMESEDQKIFVAKALEIFEKAKIGDPDYPFRIKERLERRNPGLKIKIDDDGQPLIESLAAAFYREHKRRVSELILED